MEAVSQLHSLPVDVLAESGVTHLIIHVSSSPNNFSSTNPLPLSSLRLNTGDDLFGKPITLPNGSSSTSTPCILDLGHMTDLGMCILDQVEQMQDQENLDKDPNHILPNIIAVWSSTAAKPKPSGQSVMRALLKKYVVSQEIEDGLKESQTDGASLSSSASSWQSSHSTASGEAIQIIGNMGGKSIEFHKPKNRAGQSEDPLLSSGSPFYTYPNVSLHNMLINSFSSNDAGIIPLVGLQSLDLSLNALTSWRHDVAPILTSAPNIRTLNLSSNPLCAIYPAPSSQEPRIETFAVSALNWLSDSIASQNGQSNHLHIFVEVPQSDSSDSLTETPESKAEMVVPSEFVQNPELFVPSASLNILVLNKTGISWKSFLLISSSLPSLTEAHLCFNRLRSFEPLRIRTGGRILGSSSLQLLNLDSNSIDDFTSLTHAIEHFPSLSKLIVSNNPIKRIELVSDLSPSHPFVRNDPSMPWSINLSSTSIDSWSSLQALTQMLPALVDLRWQRNKMFGFGKQPVIIPDQICRHYVVAMCPNASMVNGSKVGEHERRDSERLFLVHFFSALPSDQVPTASAEISAFLDTLSQQDISVSHLWRTQRQVTLEAYQRAFPPASSSSGANTSSSGLSLLDVSIADETGSFFVTKKLPASTSIAQLRTIINAALNQAGVASQFGNFSLFLMEPSSMGPPSLQPLTSEQSTLSHETARIKITIILRPCI
jgi:hypothetical protein